MLEVSSPSLPPSTSTTVTGVRCSGQRRGQKGRRFAVRQNIGWDLILAPYTFFLVGGPSHGRLYGEQKRAEISERYNILWGTIPSSPLNHPFDWAITWKIVWGAKKSRNCRRTRLILTDLYFLVAVVHVRGSESSCVLSMMR